MKKANGFISLLLSLVMLVASISVFPINAFAVDIYDGMEYSSSDHSSQYIIDTLNDEYWVVSENKWRSCIYNDDKELTNLVSEIQKKMYNREESYNVYFIVKDKYISASGLSRSEYFKSTFDHICEAVYGDMQLPFGGDYLRMLTRKIVMGGRSGFLSASDFNDEYSFMRMELNFEYTSTYEQEQKVKEFLNRWNEYYITGNERIAASTGETRKYYIVKTIYNYLAKNTVYDNALYLDGSHTLYPENEARYRVSHTAYGALMGNIQGSFNDDFDINTYDMTYVKDYQQLHRVHMMNQGRSVCDGYTLVFYYLCKLNSIDCRIVTGDYVSGHEKGPDPHAWNEVYLKDELDTKYEWYSIDATFGSQCTQRIADDYTFVDYEFFLRGTENKNFSADKHQQAYTIYDRSNLSPDDYRFSLQSVDVENARAIVTRRRVEDIHVKYVADGVYNLENYALTEKDKDGVHLWKIRKFKVENGNEILVDEFSQEEPGATYIYKYVNAQDSFTYYSGNDGYWYEYEIYDYAKGVEYICNDQKLKTAGVQHFNIYDPVTNEIIASRELTISKLNMSDWSSYDEDLTKYANEAYFSGNELDLYAEIVDSSHTKLVEGRDFNMFAYRKGDSTRTPVKPKEPGKYTIRIDYKGNYGGFIEFPFEVKKIDLALYKGDTIEFQYGIDIEKNIELNIKDSYGNRIEFEKNKDYKVTVSGGRDYLDEGTITVVALDGSTYLEPGTKKVWKYVVSKRLDLTSIFKSNNIIKDEKHPYSGSPIYPNKFTVTYTKADGTTIELIKDKDYKIVGYGENINSGMGSVFVEFIGNYEGSAELHFVIEKPVKFNVTVSDLTYNGKTQSPKVKVTFNGRTLTENVDYTLSGSGKEPGFYDLRVTGIDNFSRVSGKYTFIIKPSAVKSVKKTSVTANKIQLSWASQGGIAAYQVYAYDTAGKKWYKVAQTTSNSCSITAVYYKGKRIALNDATNYKFRVRAFLTAKINNKLITEYGSVTEISVYTLPKAVQLKKLTKSKNTIKCTWAKNSRATGYKLEIATNNKFTQNKKVATIKSNNTLAYTFKGLKKGKTYYVRIRAYKTVGSTTYYSAYSSVVKVKM